jgi:hypothetical protein
LREPSGIDEVGGQARPVRLTRDATLPLCLAGDDHGARRHGRQAEGLPQSDQSTTMSIL